MPNHWWAKGVQCSTARSLSWLAVIAEVYLCDRSKLQPYRDLHHFIPCPQLIHPNQDSSTTAVHLDHSSMTKSLPRIGTYSWLARSQTGWQGLLGCQTDQTSLWLQLSRVAWPLAHLSIHSFLFGLASLGCYHPCFAFQASRSCIDWKEWLKLSDTIEAAA